MLKITSSGWGHSDTSAPRSRKTLRRAIAATAVISVAAAGIVVSGGGGASAATAPNAQSRGNFLDGTLGTSPLQTLLKLKDAAAFAPGTQSVQNPLEATVLNSLTLPLTGALQLPQLLGINLGAANQVAVAHTDGFSYGASGAVANSGGAAVGGDSAAYPANATVNLTAAGIAGNTAVPIPGGGSANALGGVTLSLGAVRALAQTPTGGTPPSTTYQIATLTLNAGSPLLGGIIGSVGSAIGGLVTQLTGALGETALPSACALTSGTLPAVSLDGGAVVLDPKTGGLTIDLEKLLQTAGLNLNTLPANTDLIDYLVSYLTSPTGLAAGVEGVINGITNSLTAQFTACTAAINAIPGIGPILTTVISTLTGGQATLESTINSILAPLGNAAGPSPLAPLATVLKNLVDIGINVQPNGPAGPAGKAYTDALTASANQTVAPVAGQTVVRAIEINLLSKALNVALANAAAGPSSAAPPVTPTTTAPHSTPNTNIPTGVPAGGGSPGGSPTLPLALLAAGLMLASGGAVAFKLRGKHSA